MEQKETADNRTLYERNVKDSLHGNHGIHKNI